MPKPYPVAVPRPVKGLKQTQLLQLRAYQLAGQFCEVLMKSDGEERSARQARIKRIDARQQVLSVTISCPQAQVVRVFLIARRTAGIDEPIMAIVVGYLSFSSS
jgi:hypothetical protein